MLHELLPYSEMLVKFGVVSGVGGEMGVLENCMDILVMKCDVSM